MRSRQLDPPGSAQAAARVSGVLAGRRGGWVPPRGEPAAPPDGLVPDDPTIVGQAAARQDRDAVEADTVELPVLEPNPRHEVEPGRWDSEELADAGSSASRHGPSRAAGGRLGSRHRIRRGTNPAGRWLPAALTEGRLEITRAAVAGLLLVALLAASITGAVLWRGRPQTVAVPAVVAGGEPLPGLSRSPRPSATPAPGATDTAAEVVVSVAGKVQRPGLVRLPGGSRVDDAVRAAGGLLPGVDPGALNLARRLTDGEQVLVGIEPSPGSVLPPGAGAPSTGAAPGGRPDGRLDLNTATVAELDALPGIGPVLAQRIVERRERDGPYRSVEQLREVTGIGEAKYADLEPAVVVG